MNLTDATREFRADHDRRMTALSETPIAEARRQLLSAAERLERHLSTAPAGTTIGDLLDEESRRTNK